MKLLVIGSGGREHAMAWRLAKSEGVHKVYVALGNAGTERESGLQNVNLADPVALATFAEREGVHLTVVGPEAPLAAGLVRKTPALGDARQVASEGQGAMLQDTFLLARLGAANYLFALSGDFVAGRHFKANRPVINGFL